jgi:hypothetical protein
VVKQDPLAEGLLDIGDRCDGHRVLMSDESKAD